MKKKFHAVFYIPIL